ncbi:MAG: Uma2 family endonuclease [Chloroflexaceae bacterium]|nr:Uma2 family endonuclease [Chloroflexaceae bacterium]
MSAIPDTASVVVLSADASIVAEQRLVGAPDLVVAIASPSTAAYDRDPVAGKGGAYARTGVPKNWILDLLARGIEVLRLEGNAYCEPGRFSGDQVVRSGEVPTIAIPARRFFPRS